MMISKYLTWLCLFVCIYTTIYKYLNIFSIATMLKKVKLKLQKLGILVLEETFPSPTKGLGFYFSIPFQLNRLHHKMVRGAFSWFNVVNHVVFSARRWNTLDCEKRHWKRHQSILQCVSVNSLLVHYRSPVF